MLSRFISSCCDCQPVVNNVKTTHKFYSLNLYFIYHNFMFFSMECQLATKQIAAQLYQVIPLVSTSIEHNSGASIMYYLPWPTQNQAKQELGYQLHSLTSTSSNF